MTGSRQAFTLLSRCGKAFRPSLPSTTCLVYRCAPVESHQRRSFCTGRKVNNKSPDDFPKLPIAKPYAFVFDLIMRGFKQMSWSSQQGLHGDDVLNANAAAEEVLKFATKCLAEEDFDTLEEKFTSEALDEARPLIAATPIENRQDLIFEGSRKAVFFAGDLSFFSPWSFVTTDNGVDFTYIGMYTSSSRQTAWIITLSIPQVDSVLSDDFKVSQFHFENYLFPKEPYQNT